MHLSASILGEVIAQRKFTLLGEGGSREVIALLGTPVRLSDSIDYICPYQITGLGTEKIRHSRGIDAFQAIQMAFLMLGADLYALNKESEGKLRWEGDGSGNLGFPSPV
jgi:hypothetical protein